MTTDPTPRIPSLGAGVQSSALRLLATQGRIATFDAAVFADTGREPAAVYRHLEPLTRVFDAASIPVVRLAAGNTPRPQRIDAPARGPSTCPHTPHVDHPTGTHSGPGGATSVAAGMGLREVA